VSIWDANVSPEAVEAFGKIKDGWERLLAWGGETKAPEIRAQLSHWREVNDTVLPTITTLNESELTALANDLATAEAYAKVHGYQTPDGSTTPVATPTIEQAHAVATVVDTIAAKVPILGTVTNPAWVDKKNRELNDPTVPLCKTLGLPCSVEDIPWWAWAIGATGLAGTIVLGYAAYKAAPYVLPVVAPETAPMAEAWRRARADDDRESTHHREVTETASPKTAQAVKDLIASLGARQDQAGRELRARMAGA